MNKAMRIGFGFAVMVTACTVNAEPLSKGESALLGHYYLEGGSPDVGSELLLKSPDRFEWTLAYGAADYGAKGTWLRKGNRLVLTVSPPVKPIFRIFTDEEYHSTRPAEDGLWIAVVGVPHVRPAAGMEVQFKAKSGKAALAVSGRNGDAIVKMPSSEIWTKAGLRKAGSTEPWQWFSIGTKQAHARLTGFAITNPEALQDAPFSSLALKVKPEGLVVDDSETRLRGAYTKH